MRILLIILISCLAVWALVDRSSIKSELSIVRDSLVATQKENEDFRKTIAHLSQPQQLAEKPRNWLQERIEGRDDMLSRPPTVYGPIATPYSGSRPVTPNSRIIR